MKLKTIASIIIVVLVVFGLALIGSRGSGPKSSISSTNSTNTSSNNNNSNSTQSNSPGSANASMLFSNQPYAAYSYLVYPGTPSPQAQAALSGCSMSTTHPQNGSASITLTYVSTGDNQTVTLKPGYKLYFIETSMGDDSFGGESSLGDDGYIIVDPNGYIA